MHRHKSRLGVSPLIGTTLMILIVVMIVGVLLVFFTGIQPPEPEPKISTDVRFYSEFNNTSNQTFHYMEVRHVSGDTISREEIELVLNAGRYSDRLVRGDTGDFGPSDRLVYNITDEAGAICSSGESDVDVTVVYNTSGSVVADTSADVEGEGNGTAIISGNTVGSSGTGKFNVEVTVLGMGASGSGGGDIKGDAIHGRIVIQYDNGTTEYLTPWPDGDAGDSLDTSSPSGVYADDIWSPQASGITYTTRALPSNSTVSVDMRSYKPSSWSDTGRDITRNGNTYDITEGSGGVSDYRFWVNSDNPSENNLVLLRDGDTVPALGQSLSWQQSLKDMLRDRMDSSGVLQLESDEVVAVYELNTAGASPGSSGDYNDAVVLIKVTDVDTSVVTKGKGRHFMYCGE